VSDSTNLAGRKQASKQASTGTFRKERFVTRLHVQSTYMPLKACMLLYDSCELHSMICCSTGAFSNFVLEAIHWLLQLHHH
jgi:hypothetical protein